MDYNAAILVLLSLAPTIETRYTIPLAIAAGYNPLIVFATASVLTFVLTAALAYGLWILELLIRKIPIIRDLWERYVNSARRRVRPYVEKYGAPGVILFVAVPLPGTGVWTGSIAGYLLGIEPKKLMIYTTIGGIIANIITFFVSVGVITMIL
ncbi:MAG: hypothetical protein PWP76_110 [Candidatus Diapherotrites archaeon]|nr:hypothetical protein [Candidatus Diapherotrites archaeon]MDN5366804.1 hypothetical protein [Candidatus Diapherotrites archaeon]